MHYDGGTFDVVLSGAGPGCEILVGQYIDGVGGAIYRTVPTVWSGVCCDIDMDLFQVGGPPPYDQVHLTANCAVYFIDNTMPHLITQIQVMIDKIKDKEFVATLPQELQDKIKHNACGCNYRGLALEVIRWQESSQSHIQV